MKIAYVLPSLRQTAPIKVMRLLCSEMVKHDHDCTVYYLDSNTKQNELSFPCGIYQTDMHLTALINGDYDVIHSTGFRPDFYVSLKKSKLNALCVSTVHNFYKEDFKSSYGFVIGQILGMIWMKSLNKLDVVVTLSNEAVKYYSSVIDANKLTYAYNAIEELSEDMSDCYAQEKKRIIEFKGESNLIGIHAMFTKVKGIDIAIEAMQFLPNYKLVIIGDGKERDNLISLAEKLEVSNRILFLGYKKSAHQFLRFYDLYLIPSRSEGFPLVLLEAATACVNTVCSNLPIFNEIFTVNELTYFESENAGDLSKKIQDAMLHPEKAQRLCSVKNTLYTPEKMYNRYLSIYEKRI